MDHWGVINSIGEHMDLHSWFEKDNFALSIKLADTWPISTYHKETCCIVIKLQIPDFL